jgi:hypothetical protein
MNTTVLLLGLLTLCCFLFVLIQSRGSYIETYEDLNKSMKMKAHEYFEEAPGASGAVAAPAVAAPGAATPEAVASPIAAEAAGKEEVVKTNIEPVSEEHKKSVEATEKIKAVQGFTGFIKQGLITDRFENPVIPSHVGTHSDAILQGFQMQSSANPGCDRDPRYIRKDSVPCYNCSLK